MRRRLHSSLIALLLISPGGCRRETVIERAARHYRERQESRIALAQLETARYAAMADGQMVRARTSDGLGLAIRPQKTALQVDEPLKLRLVYANLSAHVPISATTCQGFSLMAEDETTSQMTAVDLTFSCAKDDPSRDSGVELRRGEMRSVELTTAETPIRFAHPGQYLLTAEWQSFQPRSGTLVLGREYATVTSNPVLVTVH